MMIQNLTESGLRRVINLTLTCPSSTWPTTLVWSLTWIYSESKWGAYRALQVIFVEGVLDRGRFGIIQKRFKHSFWVSPFHRYFTGETFSTVNSPVNRRCGEFLLFPTLVCIVCLQQTSSEECTAVAEKVNSLFTFVLLLSSKCNE